MERLLDTLRALRAPGGCPWDREQTHESLRPHLLEEAAEAVDAIGSGDDAHAAEELGDVLLQVAFHAVIGEERGGYDYAAIEATIVEKLVRRHPHVFGDAEAADAAAVERSWDAIKAREREAAGVAPDERPEARVPRSLPALARAAEVGRAAGWRPDPAAARRDPETLADDPAALGAALLDLALLARGAGHAPEVLLRDAIEARLARTRDDGTGEGTPS